MARDASATFLYDRSRSTGQRLQMAVVRLSNRRAAAALVAEVARLALDYVSVERDTLERSIDVVTLWAKGDADADGLVATRSDLSAAIMRADADEDFCACTCLLVAAWLFDVALEADIEAAAKRSRDLTNYLLDAMCWPDIHDEALRATYESALHEALDDRFDATRGLGFDRPEPYASKLR